MAKLVRNERGFLFDPGPKPRRPRWRGGKAVVLFEQGCPRCGWFPSETRSSVQAPLFYHGGYGEAQKDLVDFCVLCGWAGRFRRLAVNPRSLHTH